jgi:hypothetical protein
MIVEEAMRLLNKDEPLKRSEQIAKAKNACNCPDAYGIAIACCIAELPKLSLVPTGAFCPVHLPAFVCPRYQIMEW